MTFLNKHFPRVNAMANNLYGGLHLYLANGSLRAYGQFLSYVARNMLNQAVPLYASLATTYKCQCRCVHCYAAGHETDGAELDTSEAKSVIDQAKQLGVVLINLTGGEPLLREDIVELVRHAHDAGLLTRLNTNGMLLDRKRVSKLKKAGLTQCCVSVDDADPETHDRLRGVPGTYAKAIAGIRNAREFGLSCRIMTYASKGNLASGLEKTIELGRQLGVQSVYIFFPVAAGRWDASFDKVLTDEERAKVRSFLDVTSVQLELPTTRTMCSSFAKGVLYVTAHGDVTPCPLVPYVMGNIREHSLRALWDRYCAELTLECRGFCPMNDIHHREAFKRHAESVAASLRRSLRPCTEPAQPGLQSLADRS